MKLLLLFIFVFAFSNATLKNEVKLKCNIEYKRYESVVSDYLVRMKDNIRQNGCKVIPLYASIIKSENFDLLDALDENTVLMEKLLNIFYAKKELSDIVFRNNNLKTIILKNSLNNNFLDNFSFLVKKYLYHRDINVIKKNMTYLNYYILSAYYATSNKNAYQLLKKIKSSISLKLLSSYTLILNSIGDEYKFEDLLESFINIQEELSIDAIKKLSQYPKYFVYLLYPKRVDLNIDIISNDSLRDIQKDIQRKSLLIYESMFEKYRYTEGVNQQDYALLSLEYIYPYLLDGKNMIVDFDEFAELLTSLIDNNYLISLYNKDKCSKKSKINFAIFGDNNIYNALFFREKQTSFSDKLLHNLKNNKNSVWRIRLIREYSLPKF